VHLENEAWDRFFDSFEVSAWRLELHQVYTMPGERDEFAQFRRDGTLEVAADDPWLERVRHFRATGRRIGRVHVVRRPLTDYLRYEFTYQLYAVNAGEDIHVLDLTEQPDPGLPDEDFWMFDDAQIVRMMYRSDGTQIGRELLTCPDLSEFLRYRRMAQHHAVPLRQFWSEFGDAVRAG